jgi:AcrR family transcriptional regulator
MATERLRDQKREDTRRRLVEAGQRMIYERGYTDTSAADIAEAAGVTERTFFRHFASKGELIVANWRRRAEAFREALRAAPTTDDPIEVVRAALHSFASDLATADARARADAATIWANRPLVVLLFDVVIELEQDVAAVVAGRLGRSEDDLEVRVAANATVGVLRAAIRAAFTTDRGDILHEAIDAALEQIVPLFPRPVPSVDDGPRRRRTQVVGRRRTPRTGESSRG